MDAKYILWVTNTLQTAFQFHGRQCIFATQINAFVLWEYCNVIFYYQMPFSRLKCYFMVPADQKLSNIIPDQMQAVATVTKQSFAK